MASLRCSSCNTYWPNESTYRRCPECDDLTWWCSEEPIPVAEAKSRKLHAEFAAWYGDEGERES